MEDELRDEGKEGRKRGRGRVFFFFLRNEILPLPCLFLLRLSPPPHQPRNRSPFFPFTFFFLCVKFFFAFLLLSGKEGEHMFFASLLLSFSPLSLFSLFFLSSKALSSVSRALFSFERNETKKAKGRSFFLSFALFFFVLTLPNAGLGRPARPRSPGRLL